MKFQKSINLGRVNFRISYWPPYRPWNVTKQPILFYKYKGRGGTDLYLRIYTLLLGVYIHV